MQAALLARLALAASVLGFILRGTTLTGGADGMTDPEMLDLLLQTPVGDALVFRIIGAGLIIVGVFVPSGGAWTTRAGGSFSLWSFVQIRHVPEMMQTVAHMYLFLHLLGIAFWQGFSVKMLHSVFRCGQGLLD